MRKRGARAPRFHRFSVLTSALRKQVVERQPRWRRIERVRPVPGSAGTTTRPVHPSRRRAEARSRHRTNGLGT
jgi:hypothetical protein